MQHPNLSVEPYDGGGVCVLCNGDTDWGILNHDTFLSVEFCKSCAEIVHELTAAWPENVLSDLIDDDEDG